MSSMRLIGLLAASLVAACASDPDGSTRGGGGGGKSDDPVEPGVLPADLPAWGGSDASRWSLEAIVANAVTAELQRTQDPFARVSVPASLWTSQFAPFGDGQTNAAVALGSWTAKRVPVIATRSGTRLTIRLDRALPLATDVVELWTSSGTWVASADGTRTADGDLVIETDLRPELADGLRVSPRGWADTFPLSFALLTTRVGALAATVPPALATLPGGEPVVDPIGAAGDTPFATLTSSSFPSGFINQTPFLADQLHAAFPQAGPPRVTAVGGAYTWVAEQPFKDLYVCFDRRQRDREAELGVPSGAGWHHIGDAGETILSSLERAPILVGYAAPTGQPGAAYGLDRATVYGLLQPGDAFTSPRGSLHWYAVHHDTNPCVQIWVHRCEPDGASFACPGD